MDVAFSCFVVDMIPCVCVVTYCTGSTHVYTHGVGCVDLG